MICGLSCVDCPRVGPGPCGPGSGPDCRGRSEGPGQVVAEWTGPGGVQGQTLDGPTLGVGPDPDPDLAYHAYASTVFFRFYFARSLCRSTGQAE